MKRMIRRGGVMHAACMALFAMSAHAADTVVPAHWKPWGPGDALTEYTVERSADAKREGQFGATIRHTSGPGERFATLGQVLDASAYRGKRITFSAWLRTENAGSAQLWLRIDSATASMAMDNMEDRPVKGTTPWAQHQIVMDVPQEARVLLYGAILQGKGRVDMDSVRLDITPDAPKPTLLYDAEALKAPVKPSPVFESAPANLGFED